MDMMLGHYISQNYAPIEKEFVQPVPDSYFIHWLFKYRCIQCKKPGMDVNEIVPRSRSKKSIQDWRNRVVLCRECHHAYHKDGVTDEKILKMKNVRRDFLVSMGRMEYV